VEALDQFSKDRFFFDDPGVILDIGRRDHEIDEGRDVGGSPDRIEVIAFSSSLVNVMRSAGSSRSDRVIRLS